MREKQGYELTATDCEGLANIRSMLAAMADFATAAGSHRGGQDLERRVRWMDSFMDRIGATELLVAHRRERSAFHIPTDE